MNPTYSSLPMPPEGMGTATQLGQMSAPAQDSAGVEDEMHVAGLNVELARRFKALQDAVARQGGSVMVASGARDAHEQTKMFQEALRRFGGDEKLAAKAVAPPGESLHHPDAGMKYGLGRGALSLDLRGDLDLAYRLAPKYGLVFPQKDNPGHVEYAGLKETKP